MDRTAEILARLATADTPQAIAGIIQDFGFEFVATLQSTTGKVLRFYTTNEGSGEILIGTGMYENGNDWFTRFAFYAHGQAPTDMFYRLRFMQ